MTNYREILRLYRQGISLRGISRSLSCSRNTVSQVIQKANEAELTWLIAETLTNQQIEIQLFPDFYLTQLSSNEPKTLINRASTFFLGSTI